MLSINRLRKGPKDLRISCFLNGDHVIGVVDTAADVTVISENVYKMLSKKPELEQELELNAAGENLKIYARVNGTFKIPNR